LQFGIWNLRFGRKAIAAAFLLAACLSLTGCRKADPEMQRRAMLKLTADNMRRCLPQATVNNQVSLAIVAIARETDATVLRMVAYATTQPTEFRLPIYLMSRGRWTINTNGRAYLLDENCREYRLKDTYASAAKALPQDGKVQLQPGESFEFRLSFPRLPDEMQMGTLIYGSNVIAFSLLVETR
jgi:hypothetical protein